MNPPIAPTKRRGRKPKPWIYVCACGQSKSSRAKRCLMCERQRLEQMVPLRICQWCQSEFRRKGRRVRDGHDILCFCSKKCWGACRSARFQAEQNEYRQACQISRELKRAQRLYARSICACGATITRRCGTLCNTCAAEHKREGIHRARSVSRTAGVRHICPNCGESFRGYASDVHCSTRCCKQLRKKGQRYPVIGALPLQERNRIAELVALVRAARRRIWGGATGLRASETGNRRPPNFSRALNLPGRLTQ